MKSYIQGLITGGVLVFAMFVFMGQSNLEKRQLEKQKREKEIQEKMRELNNVQAELDKIHASMQEEINQSPKNIFNLDDAFLISINNRFDELSKQVTDNNGILQDIYTDGVPCNN